jgi:uncharacterized protein (DUF111 family)
MIYQFKIKFNKEDKGELTTAIEQYLTDKELFSEVEASALEMGLNDPDVTAIKRTMYREMANQRSNEDDKIYDIRIVSSYVDDKGKEKLIPYHVALFAANVDDANTKANEYMKQGLEDMRLDAIRETKIVDFI